MESTSKILIDETADYVEDASREKPMGMKFTLNEKLETIHKIDELILENTQGKDVENEVENSVHIIFSEEYTLQCIFCKKNHKSITCNTITEPKTKRTMLRRSGRWFFFLLEGGAYYTRLSFKSQML